MSRPSPVPPWPEGCPGILTLMIAGSRFWGARCGITSLAVPSMGRHLGGGEWHAFVGEEGKRANTPTSMTHAGADCRADPTLAASYERRQCCWHPETPSQSAGIRGASLVFLWCLQRGWSTCALGVLLPFSVTASLPGPNLLSSSRLAADIIGPTAPVLPRDLIGRPIHHSTLTGPALHPASDSPAAWPRVSGELTDWF